MHTPLDLRNRRREAQRAVRLALNAINSSLGMWKDAVGRGKQYATSFTNAALTQLHLPAMQLAMFSSFQDLQTAALAKLQQQQDASLAGLAVSLAQLRTAVEGLSAAAGGVQQLMEAEAESPLLQDSAVFAALPLRLLGAMLAEVHDMHARELAVKAGVVQGFRGLADELRAGAAGSGSSGGVRAAQREAALRRTSQVYLAAWLLSPEVDDARLEAHLQLLAAEMRGF